MSWISVKMVLLRRGFFEHGGGCSASDSLLPGASLGERSVPAAPPQGWAGGTRELPAAGRSWGSTGGCRVMTEMRGYARREGEPGREQAEVDEYQISAYVFEEWDRWGEERDKNSFTGSAIC